MMHKREAKMIVADMEVVAAENGRRLAIRHPYVDVTTALKTAALLFEKPSERDAFLKAWLSFVDE